MRCNVAQRLISDSIDREAPLSASVSLHVAGCADCARFESRAVSLRESLRAWSSVPAPDLAPSVIAAIRQEERVATPVSRPVRRRWAAPALATAVGAVVAVVVVAQSLVSPSPQPALASDVPERIVAHAPSVSSYSAAYRIQEHGWPGVGTRTFDAQVAFAAPERFSVVVRDLTTYPSASWTPNDSRTVVDGSRWWSRGPEPCVAGVVGACLTHVVTRSTKGRPPFDGGTPVPTDVILPLTSIGGSEGIPVVSRSTIAGREAVEVSLSASQAGPLLSFFEQAGSWLPIHPSDHVSLWLDANDWFPLAYTVTAAPGADRAAWAAANGLRNEPAGTALLQVRLTSLSLAAPPDSVFRIPNGGPAPVDEGFAPARPSNAPPATPAYVAGLAPYRSGTYTNQSSMRTLSYAAGLSWLRIDEQRGSASTAVPPYAQRVELPSGGVAYSAPASDPWPRRVWIHTPAIDVTLMSDLPSQTLLKVADSMHLRGIDLPTFQETGGGRTVRTSLSEAEVHAGFDVAAPSSAPSGYDLSAVQLSTATNGRSVTMYYARPGFEPGGYGIRVFETRATSLPPAVSTGVLSVRIGSVTARWTPETESLDWLRAGGVYVSVSAPDGGLEQAVEVARSLVG